MHQTEECAQPDALKLNSQKNYYNFSVILFYSYRKISGSWCRYPFKTPDIIEADTARISGMITGNILFTNILSSALTMA